MTRAQTESTPELVVEALRRSSSGGHVGRSRVVEGTLGLTSSSGRVHVAWRAGVDKPAFGAILTAARVGKLAAELSLWV